MVDKVKEIVIPFKVTKKSKGILEKKAKKYSNGNVSEFIRTCINHYIFTHEEVDGARTHDEVR